MCLQIEIAFSVPDETARIAHAAFPKGNPYMQMRDLLGTLFKDEQFTQLFPPQGQPAEAPWRLALTSVFQFAEGLSDRQAAEAVRSRIDWKYAMGLLLTDPGWVRINFRASLLIRRNQFLRWGRSAVQGAVPSIQGEASHPPYALHSHWRVITFQVARP